MKKILFTLILLLSVAFVGCGSDGGEGKDDKCKNVDCGGHGTCNDSSGYAFCDCDDGYVSNGLTDCILYVDPCKDVTCDAWEYCTNGQCKAQAGKCNSDADCNGGTCKTADHTCEGGNQDPCSGITCGGHGTCVAEGYGYNAAKHCDCDTGYKVDTANSLNCIPDNVDPCADVTCDSWKECISGVCELKDGMCSTTSDCDGGKICNTTTHTCVSDPCSGVTCSGKGTCSVDNGTPVCNCEHTYSADGTNCILDDTILKSPDEWCGIKWVGAANGDIEADLNAPATKIYAQIWIKNQTSQAGALSNVKAQMGYTTGSVAYPIVADNYTWVDSTYNTSCTACGENDEYMTDFPTSTAGRFKFIVRFSKNNGTSWAYCDKTPNFITSATNMPGVAVIGGGGPLCGGENCDEWEQCVADSCIPQTGMCNTANDCNAGQLCNTSTHQCQNDTGAPRVELVAQPTVTANSYSFQVKYTGSNAIDLSQSQITLNGQVVNLSTDYNESTKTFTVSKSSLTTGKYTYLFRVKDANGTRAKALYVPMWVEAVKFEWRDAFIYQVMTDRFVNADTTNDFPVAGVDTERNWQGGDLKGLKTKMQYFKDMGVNTLWISSPILNTNGKGKGVSDGQWYSGYHSYWPIATGWTDTNHLPGIDGPVDPHFGTEAELKDFIKVAHDNGIRVIADFVANHVFGITNGDLASGSTSPLWDQHRNDGWFYNSDSPYVCGWERPIDCWFTTYLPDLNYTNSSVMSNVMDHAIWMVQEYDFDGFRLDAVKHMVMAFTTTIRAKIQAEVVTTGIPFYMVGETFDGDANYLYSFVGADKLDGQFEFGYYFAIRDQVLQNGNLQSFKEFTDWNDNFYYSRWSGALMSNFIGNHDVQRALRFASGNHTLLRIAQAILMMSPSIPLIYQGDDLGMDGGGDPDNRRMMRFDSSLSADESTTLTQFKKLGVFRAEHKAARRGTRSTCGVGQNFWIYKLTIDTDVVIVGVNKGSSESSANCEGVSGNFKNAFTGTTSNVSGNISVPGNSVVVLGKVN